MRRFIEGLYCIPRVPECLSLRPNWLLPSPLPQASVSPRNQRGGNIAYGWGGGGSQFGRLERKPAMHSVYSVGRWVSQTVELTVVWSVQTIPECPTYTVTLPLPLQHLFFLLSSANTQTKPDNESLWGGILFSNGANIFYFCRLYPFPPSHHESVWLLPVISLSLTNPVSLVRACLSIWLERFRSSQKERRAWASKYSILSAFPYDEASFLPLIM